MGPFNTNETITYLVLDIKVIFIENIHVSSFGVVFFSVKGVGYFPQPWHSIPDRLLH